MKIIDYLVAVSPTSNDLSNVVSNHLKEGWQPHGSIVYYNFKEGEHIWAQPMVKYQE